MNSLKRFLIVAFISQFCLSSLICSAQIRNTGILYYLSENKSESDPQATLLILKFNDGKCYWINKVELRSIKVVSDNLKKDPYFYDKCEWRQYNSATFDREMSNDKWIVYSMYNKRIPAFYDMYMERDIPESVAHTSYYAFRNDYSQLMEWSEPLYVDMFGNTRGHRITYNLITKEELMNMQFTAARDFLR